MSLVKKKKIQWPPRQNNGRMKWRNFEMCYCFFHCVRTRRFHTPELKKIKRKSKTIPSQRLQLDDLILNTGISNIPSKRKGWISSLPPALHHQTSQEKIWPYPENASFCIALWWKTDIRHDVLMYDQITNPLACLYFLNSCLSTVSKRSTGCLLLISH